MCDSKAALCASTGAARTAVTTAVNVLVRQKLLTFSGWVEHEGRGRPAERLVVRPEWGLVVAIDGGATGHGIAICDMTKRVLAHRFVRHDVRGGPESTLDLYARSVKEMLAGCRTDLPVLAAVVGIPARIDRETQRPVRPTVMPGWDGYPVVETLGKAFGAPVSLENDTNLRCVGEACSGPPSWLPILSIKVGTGIGAGLIDQYGHVYYGASGAAGEIGHIPIAGADETVCNCGSVGCVEANASVRAMINKLRGTPGSTDEQSDDLDALLRGLAVGDPEIVRIVRDAGEKLGDVAAILCNVLNPRRLMISCPISAASDDFLAGVRSRVYERARPLATRDLVIGYSSLGAYVGVAGAMMAAIDRALTVAVAGR